MFRLFISRCRWPTWWLVINKRVKWLFRRQLRSRWIVANLQSWITWCYYLTPFLTSLCFKQSTTSRHFSFKSSQWRHARGLPSCNELGRRNCCGRKKSVFVASVCSGYGLVRNWGRMIIMAGGKRFAPTPNCCSRVEDNESCPMTNGGPSYKRWLVRKRGHRLFWERSGIRTFGRLEASFSVFWVSIF